jgi:hypothetical protein
MTRKICASDWTTPRSLKVFANFAEHIAALGVERAYGECVRIGLGSNVDG